MYLLFEFFPCTKSMLIFLKKVALTRFFFEITLTLWLKELIPRLVPLPT